MQLSSDLWGEILVHCDYDTLRQVICVNKSTAQLKGRERLWEKIHRKNFLDCFLFDPASHYQSFLKYYRSEFPVYLVMTKYFDDWVNPFKRLFRDQEQALQYAATLTDAKVLERNIIVRGPVVLDDNTDYCNLTVVSAVEPYGGEEKVRVFLSNAEARKYWLPLYQQGIKTFGQGTIFQYIDPKYVVYM